MNSNIAKKGFTLLELLIVIAIIAFLSVIIFLVISPSEILKKSRDSQRISDLATLKTAIGIYQVNIIDSKIAGINNYGCRGTITDTTWQPTDYIYYSYPADGAGSPITNKILDGTTFTTGGAHQVSSTSLYSVDGTGWLPINLTSIYGGSPISYLPVDPVNKMADPANPNSTDLVYRYVCSEKTLRYEIDATLESKAYAIDNNLMSQDGGNNDNYYEAGTDLSLFDSENLVSNGTTNPLGSSFIDSGQLSFDAGNYYRVMYSGIDNSLELDSIGLSNGSGTYTSEIKNVDNANLLSLSWTPNAPYGKPLPNNQQSEVSYPTANVNMRGNILLFHGDEALGATTFTDNSGLNNNGICGLNCPQAVTGKINSGLSFNSATSSIVVANSPSLNPSNNITIEAWVKWEINPALGAPWATIVNKNLDNQYRLQHNSNNSKFEFAIAMNYIPSLTTPQVGKWYHLVGTYDGSTIRFYVNGIEESTRSYSGTIAGSANPLTIGGRFDGTRLFKGSVDEVAVYNRALTSSEIVDRYNRGVKMLKIQLRTCSDQSCSGSVFIGPDGTINSYYSDNEFQLGLPAKSLLGLSGNYFQYQVIFETNTSVSPKLHNLSVD